MRVAPSIHLVASGRLGFDLTDMLDCNVWLLDLGADLALFDSGAGRDVDGLLEEVRGDGLDPARIRHLFLTHAHADHSGGACGLAERLPGLHIHSGARTAALLARDDPALISLDRAKRGGFYPADYVWRAPRVDDVIAAEEKRAVGGAEITLLETPGHSADHASFLVGLDGRTLLISGDALFAGGRVVLQDIEDCSVAQLLATIRALSAVAFDVFLPGHGLFSLRDGRRHVDAAMEYAERLVPPPNLI